MDLNDEIMEKVKNNTLTENDTFKFGCVQCGECCRNRHDIILSPYDLYRIAKFLGMTIDKVIEKYCESYIGKNSKLPVVRAKPKIHNEVCPFLKKGKCSVHEVKPALCALFPLGRVASPNGELRYFYNGSCDVSNKTEISLKEWIEKFNLRDSEEPAKLWGQILGKLCMVKSIMNITKENDAKINLAVFNILYRNYKTDIDFLPQFMSNTNLMYSAFKLIFGKSIDKVLKGKKLNSLQDMK